MCLLAKGVSAGIVGFYGMLFVLFK